MNLVLNWNEYEVYSKYINEHFVLENNTSADNPEIKKVQIKVNYAIRDISIRYKFFAALAYNLRLIYTYEVKTAAVDGTNIFISPKFFAPLNEAQITFIICHEIMHCVLLHIARMNGRAHYRWNVACDYEINLLLSNIEKPIVSYDEIKNDPLNGLINKLYKNRSAEELYNDPELVMPEQDVDKEPNDDNGSDGSSSGESQPLKVGDIIYDKVSKTYGKVNTIDLGSGNIDYSPLTKEAAREIVNNK